MNNKHLIINIFSILKMDAYAEDTSDLSERLITIPEEQKTTKTSKYKDY